MAGAFERAVELYESLKREWKAGNSAACTKLLADLKIQLTQLSFLPNRGEDVKEKELLLAREVLEVGAQHSIREGDVAAFERYMAQLKPYYYDFGSKLPTSSFKHELIGLHLLSLLSQSRIAEFHTEIERLEKGEEQDNVYIRHPVALEQYLMEGAYNKVYLARDSAPAESYSFFIDILMHTIRDEIAACSAKAYEHIPYSDGCKMFFLTSEAELQEFIAKHEWQVSGGRIYFPPRETASSMVDAPKIINRVLEYSKELERIV